jgi:hypothetical protein
MSGILWSGLDSGCSGYGRVVGCFGYGKEALVSREGEELLDHLSD